MSDSRLPALHAAHEVQLLQGGQSLFAEMVYWIDRSVHEVRIETYIFHFDASGELVAQALERAAGRGVTVYLVMDGVGTPQLPPAWAARFDRAGVQWRVFRPLGRIGLLIPSRWRRLHRKLCVVDGLVAFCGGINILDDWNDPNHGALQSPRLDFAVRVAGPLVRLVHRAMVQFWMYIEAVREARSIELGASWEALQQAVRGAADSVIAEEAREGGVSTGQGARAMLLLRDNWRHRARIERAYLRAIDEAREEIIIANAYFVPGRRLRKALVQAARRGVRVRLLMQGRYEYFMQFHAVRMVYGVLLAQGIEIHEYAPSFLHAKVAVVDGLWSTVGSSNLDPLSLLLAREANVVVIDAPFARELRARLLHAIEHEGRRVEPEEYARRPWQQRVLDAVAFGLMRAALFLTGLRY